MWEILHQRPWCVFWTRYASCKIPVLFLLPSSHASTFSITEHQNYFGIDESLGPVAVSVRREKVEDPKEKEGPQFNYRVVFRTSEVLGARGVCPGLDLWSPLGLFPTVCCFYCQC